jgi:hypothetical protein
VHVYAIIIIIIIIIIAAAFIVILVSNVACQQPTTNLKALDHTTPVNHLKDKACPSNASSIYGENYSSLLHDETSKGISKENWDGRRRRKRDL